MLNPAENERLTRVGPGTSAGALLRRYWQPALLSSELPDEDGAPLRLRLLGEDLVAFRDSNGHVGIVDAYCPHRGAPMFFGRNEECGIRCSYHGWKFVADGTCVDIPSEPPESLFRAKVRIGAYRTWEGGDIIWVYMGPMDSVPPYPDYEWVRAPASHRRVSKTLEEANYLQALEGGLDTAHSSFAHNEKLGDKNWIRNRDGSPRLDVKRTEFGYTYVSTRDLGPEGAYVRGYQYVMPAQALRGGVTSFTGTGRAELPRLDGHIWVPVDDDTTWVWNMVWSYDHRFPLSDEWHQRDEAFFGRGIEDLIPGTFRLKKNRQNDYHIDRQMQKTKNFTGIVGINTQDMALQEGMGNIVDRSQEHLGTSDKAIIACRHLLLEAIRDVEDGLAPKGSDPASYREVRPYDAVLPNGKDWETEFALELKSKF